MALSVLLLVVLEIGIAVGYQSYQVQIPNGGNVPNPCNPGSMWPGVGHRNFGGGGNRNQFGNDFGQTNSWASICRLDSDGDGRTNGQELGDPQCRWRAGRPNPVGTTLTHPGICEPICSASCRLLNSGLQCNGINNCPTPTKPPRNTTPAHGTATPTTPPRAPATTRRPANCGCARNCRPVLRSNVYVCDCSSRPSRTCANVRCKSKRVCAMVQGKCTRCSPSPQCLPRNAVNGIAKCSTNTRCLYGPPTVDVCGCYHCPAADSDADSDDDSGPDDD